MIAFELDEQIDAYEAALVAGQAGTDDMDRFLPPPNEPHRTYLLIELLRITLEHQWQRDQAVGIAAFLDRFPELNADPALIEPLAYEEYRLRIGDGQIVDRQEYAARYGVDVAAWKQLSPEAVTADDAYRDESNASWNEFSQSAPAVAAGLAIARQRLPAVGERFGPFRLVALLGQGAFGKVFLARQATLADRYVALKITAGPTVEADRLARLQHSNIVPVYSVHRRGRLSGVCMPFLGSVTLADLLAKLKAESSLPNSAQSLAETVAARQAELSTVIQPQQPQTESTPDSRPVPRADHALSQLASRPWAEAACWIMSRVAAGLSHAHLRGIVHRDLKPANILIGDDGEPLVLDFNLAADRSHEAGHLARLGGTLPYMSPEQFESFQGGSADISSASDVYSLGVVLYEALTRQHPFPIRQGPLDDVVARMLQDRREQTPQPIRQLNPAVSPGLAAIVAKCLQPEAALRYRDAGELHEDLQRHLEHRPLRHAHEHSVVELTQKWRRRHPRLSSATGVTLIALFVAGVLGSIWRSSEHRHAVVAAEHAFEQFHATVPSSRTLLIVANSDSAEEREGVAAAKELLATYQVANNSRWYSLPAIRRLSRESQMQLAADIADLSNLLGSRVASGESLHSLANDPWFVTSTAAIQDRRETTDLLTRLHRDAQQGRIHRDAQQGRSSAEAIRALDEFTRAHPTDVAGWLVLCDCRRLAGDCSGAETACTAAIALRSDLFLTWYFRGIVRLQHNRPSDAEADFTEVLARRPSFLEGWANRGVARKLLGQHAPAIDDLNRAIDSGLEDSLVFFTRAQCYKALGETDKAKADFEAGARFQAKHAQRWYARGMAHIELQDFEAAERDFTEAAKIAPRYLVALRNLAHIQSEKLFKIDDAIATLNRILQLQPADLSARISRGVLYARQEKKEEALQDAEAVLQRNPPPHELCQAASLFALLAKDDADLRKRALDYLEQSLTKQPNLASLVESDPDMANLRVEPRFRQLMAAHGAPSAADGKNSNE